MGHKILGCDLAINNFLLQKRRNLTDGGLKTENWKGLKLNRESERLGFIEEKRQTKTIWKIKVDKNRRAASKE